MSELKLQELNSYDYSKQELIDIIGDNFRQLWWWAKNNIGGDNVSPQYINQQIVETIQVDSGVEDAIRAIIEAMGDIGGGDDYIEAGIANYASQIDFTFVNSYTVQPVVTTNCLCHVAYITEGSGETLQYNGVRITPISGGTNPIQIHMMAVCSGKVGGRRGA